MSTGSKFLDLLERDGAVLMDGGLATQLEAQGCDINDALWSAGLLLSAPEQIVKAHRAFIDAGAEVIATAGYQASREGFAQKGLSSDEADGLMLKSIDLVRKAANESGQDVAIAMSLGPYGAMLHDGSEYHGNYGVDDETLRKFHTARLDVLDSVGVDVIALETIPSLQEATVLAEVLDERATPAWVSFSCGDGQHACDGHSVETVAKLFAGHSTVRALGINCTPPQYTSELVQRVRTAVPEMAVLAYPNSGETWHAETGTWLGTAAPLDYANAAKSWADAGAKLVGGCCRTGPEHIRAMREALLQ